jgi:hypothetical protein
MPWWLNEYLGSSHPDDASSEPSRFCITFAVSAPSFSGENILISKENRFDTARFINGSFSNRLIPRTREPARFGFSDTIFRRDVVCINQLRLQVYFDLHPESAGRVF